MFTIHPHFIGDFKLGDNINYNFCILNALYTSFEAADEQQRLYLLKPIIITLMSIIEAVLHDFCYRAKFHTREGIPSLRQDILDSLRSKKIDDLEKYISAAKKHHLFDTVHEDFYTDLDRLRKIRNRVHIQNKNKNLPIKELEVFKNEDKYLAECALEVVLRTLNKKFSRPEHTIGTRTHNRICKIF